MTHSLMTHPFMTHPLMTHPLPALDEQLAAMPVPAQEEHKERMLQQRDDHPGCMMTGFLLVNKVPGNKQTTNSSPHLL